MKLERIAKVVDTITTVVIVAGTVLAYAIAICGMKQYIPMLTGAVDMTDSALEGIKHILVLIATNVIVTWCVYFGEKFWLKFAIKKES